MGEASDNFPAPSRSWISRNSESESLVSALALWTGSASAEKRARSSAVRSWAAKEPPSSAAERAKPENRNQNDKGATSSYFLTPAPGCERERLLQNTCRWSRPCSTAKISGTRPELAALDRVYRNK